tara:strand:- start:81 stop:455 length:375 start_codon:yes stop_codon:yes gene_type:complete
VGNAYGEDEVYYCAETDSNGFWFDKTLKKYKPKRFVTDKFKLKLDRIAKTIEIKGHSLNTVNSAYICRATLEFAIPEFLSCTNDFYHFNFNAGRGRFVLAVDYGNAGTEGIDGMSISYGKCDKF